MTGLIKMTNNNRHIERNSVKSKYLNQINERLRFLRYGRDDDLAVDNTIY